MIPKRVLFYLEPVTYANSPLRLAGWWNFFSAFAERSKAYFISQIAASPAICSLPSDAFAGKHCLDQIALLRSTNFNRARYSRDLCSGLVFSNRALISALVQLKKDFDPDIIISVTDNKYLKKVFGRKVMFMELGPLPRTGIKPSVYVDPYGHQVKSALNWFSRSKWEHPLLPHFAEVWRERWVEPILEASQSRGIESWLKKVGEGRELLLAALQPSDWITYEGVGSILDPISLLRRLADDIDDRWIIIPQWHSSDVSPSNDLIEELSKAQPNIAQPPSEFRIAHSEIMLPSIDAVATISSNVAAAGMILGKRLKILGRSKFYMVGRSHNNHPRSDILAFLSCRYCKPLDDFLTQEGIFAEHILRLADQPRWLFDSKDINVKDLDDFFISAT